MRAIGFSLSSSRLALSLSVCLAFYFNYRLTAKYSPTINLTAITKWEDVDLPRRQSSQDHDHVELYDPCHVFPGEGEERNDGFQALYAVDIPNVTYSTGKILCVLYNATSIETIHAAFDVYGRRCDNFLAATARPISTGLINSSHILSTKSTDWENLVALLRHVVEHDFDILHIATERTLVIVENLRQFIDLKKASNDEEPLYFGGPALFADNPRGRYCSPGAGYSLNQRAVKLVLQCQDPSNATNLTNVHEQLADCLYQHRVVCKNTMDASRLRYLEYGPEFAATFRKANPGPVAWKALAWHHRIHMDRLLFGVSNSVIGIHLADTESPYNTTTSNGNLMRRFNNIVRKTCEENWSKRLPHGALDENDNTGYVHDPTYLRRHPLKVQWTQQDVRDTCNYTMGTSVEGSRGVKGLKKIEVRKTKKKTRLFCAIYSHADSHKDRVEAVAETYAPHCDGFMAASTMTDRRIGAVNLLHEGPESLYNMWLKVRAIWKYIYQHYLDDFDFFHMGGDDMYVIPENLKHLVSTGSITGRWNQSLPLYFGTPMVDPRYPRYFCGGGAGYTLNRAAVKLLVEELFATSTCSPHYRTSQEDRKIADCFRLAGIVCPNTQDTKGEERYHHTHADWHAKWRKGKPSVWAAPEMKKRANITAPDYLRQISKDSVTFHLKGTEPSDHFVDRGMRRYHGIVYGYCNT